MRTRVFAVVILLSALLTAAAYGQFYNPRRFALNAYKMVSADFNNDNQPDLASINISGPSIDVLLGDGSGGFSSKSSPITGVRPDSQCYWGVVCLVVGDFNGDGIPDVVFNATDNVTNGPVVALMFGNGDGTFQATRKAVNGLRGRIAVGDFNGDGKADIAIGDGQIAILMGKGDGTFGQPIVTQLFTFDCLAAGDFNHDGKLDLVVGGPRNTRVLFGKGDGTFEKKMVTVRGGCPVFVADVNQDGNLDLMARTDTYQTTVVVFLNDGTGHFPKSNTYGSGSILRGLAVGDFDGNGSPDLAVTDSNADVTILLNKGDGTFRTGRTFAFGGQDVVAGDFSKKKKGHPLDLALLLGHNTVAVLSGNGDGTFQDNLVQDGNFGVSAVRVGDFNRDHKLDLVTDSAVLLGNRDGTFGNPIPLPNGCARTQNSFPRSIAVGDFNHDGKLDIAVVEYLGSGVFVCLGNGDGTFQKVAVYDQGIQHNSILAGDFNNDGKLDLAVSDAGGISILLGNGDGTFQSGIPTGLNASFPNFRLGDFNGDGKLDVAAITNSGIAVLPGKGDGTFGAPIISTAPANAFTLVAGDLNGDGKRDLVTTNFGNGDYSISVLLGKGDGSFKSPVSYPVPQVPFQAVLGDFNGDNKLDVAVMTGHLVLVFLGKGDGGLTGPEKFHAIGAAMAEGDFTGDGDLDLVLLRSAYSQGEGLEVLLNVK